MYQWLLRTLSLPVFIASILLVGCGAPPGRSLGPPPVRAATPAEKEALIDLIKAMEGDWITLDATGKEVLTSSFKVTAGGSVVREVVFPGQPQEMTNLYHMDGPDLILTHYAALGNQPRLRASQGKLKGVIQFELDSITDWKGASQPYRGALVLRVLDPNHVIFSWSVVEAGQVSGHAEFDLRRKK